jgi:FO synthase
VLACLAAGCNDLGGTLMNESITKAAGAEHGQETSPKEMIALIEAAGRRPRQRTTDYRDATPERIAAGLAAGTLTDVVNDAPRKRAARPGRTLLRPGRIAPVQVVNLD